MKTVIVTYKTILRNKRLTTILSIILCILVFAGLSIAGFTISEKGLRTDLEERNLSPDACHIFGTDWLGRDMLTRIVKGLNLSLKIGLIAAGISTMIAVMLGLCSALFGGMVDFVIIWMIDLFMSLPHLVFLVLISFAAGGGAKGVVIGVAVTHWPALARVIRAEVLQLMNTEYIQIASKLGQSNTGIMTHHLLPHIVPQFLVGMILLFPHAILHEAGLSFIGMGLSPHTPAIGIILSESMRHLSTGYWWLAVIPGACLLFMVKLFDILGENIRDWVNPKILRG
ncbi:MAG: ABC transporter permease [Proteobacteria bacterium]|nr:ABC transporter permease [Pseudomonadota bacterium]